MVRLNFVKESDQKLCLWGYFSLPHGTLFLTWCIASRNFSWSWELCSAWLTEVYKLKTMWFINAPLLLSAHGWVGMAHSLTEVFIHEDRHGQEWGHLENTHFWYWANIFTKSTAETGMLNSPTSFPLSCQASVNTIPYFCPCESASWGEQLVCFGWSTRTLLPCFV